MARMSLADASPQNRILWYPSSSIWPASACGRTLRGAIVAHPAVKKMIEQIKTKRNVGSNSSDGRGNIFKVFVASSRCDHDPLGVPLIFMEGAVGCGFL